MAALVAGLNIIFQLILTIQMAEQVEVTYVTIFQLNLTLQTAALIGVKDIIII